MKMAKIELKRLNIYDGGMYRIFKGPELIKYIKSFHGSFYNKSNNLEPRQYYCSQSACNALRVSHNSIKPRPGSETKFFLGNKY